MHIDYIEFPSSDFVKTQAFYVASFDWSFEVWSDDYIAFSGAGLEGGFRSHTGDVPRGGALVILHADDLEAAEEKIRNAGGTITEHHAFPGGKRFHFCDPTGNELAVWKRD